MQPQKRADTPNLENIFNAMVDGVVIVSPQYDILFLNKVLKDEFGGYEGRKCFDYFHGNSSPCPWCKAGEVYSGKTVRWKWQFKKNNKMYDLIDTPFRNPDNSISKLKILRDITENKLTQEWLRIQTQRIRIFFNSLNDAIFVHPLKEEGFAPFVEVNDIACERYGYSYDEFLQLSAPDITKKTDASSHSARSHRSELLRRGRLVFETVHVKKSGEQFPVEINSNIIYEGGKMFILAVVRDITERKSVEAQLRKIQQLEAVATLSGGIAHEFNNALNVVSGNIELLEMMLPDHENVIHFGRQAMASIERLSRLTSQLHAYARGGKYRAKRTNLSEFVRAVLPDISSRLQPYITVDVDLPEDISSIHADPIQLQMVLSAILTNASEAMDGSGNIRIQTGEKEVDGEFAASHPGVIPGRYIFLTVTDNGFGMDEKTKSRIFDPFFTTKFQGRGLGMAAVYGIVKSHNGYVYVDSEPGKGTAVHLFFPKEQKGGPLISTRSPQIDSPPGRSGRQPGGRQ